jgi:hypothetical protein
MLLHPRVRAVAVDSARADHRLQVGWATPLEVRQRGMSKAERLLPATR